MLVVGELINTSRSKIREAVETRDAGNIERVAKLQAENGANYLDINCGTMISEEVQIMEWLVNAVQAVTDLPLCIDSPARMSWMPG